MNNRFNVLLLITVFTLGFISCKKENNNTITEGTKGNYVINYGNYSGGKSTITLYDTENDTTVQKYYQGKNNYSIVSNIQHACNFNNNIYFMGNNTDEIMFVDENTFEQTKNAITKDIVQPRFAIGNGSYLYVSCWGGDMWIDNSTSYIAKINISTNLVEEKIALPGGPEGLAIANNKLYAALNYKDSIAVIDLSSESVSYIISPAVTSYFIKDNAENLYVSLVSTYSNYSENTGLAYINTTTDQIEVTYSLDGVSSNYGSILAANSDRTKVYVVASAWVLENEEYVLKGSLATFNTSSKAFETSMFIEGVTGINAVSVDQTSDDVILFISPSATENGSMKIFNSTGTLIKEHQTGIAPFMMITVD